MYLSCKICLRVQAAPRDKPRKETQLVAVPVLLHCSEMLTVLLLGPPSVYCIH